MRRFLVTSAVVVLGCAGLAVASFAQVVPQAVPPPVTESNGGIIVIQGPYYPVSSQLGDLRLIMPGTMLDDSVYLDGSYVGVASQAGDIEMAPGAHELLLCAPDGTPVYRHDVTVGINETTEVRPFAALDNGLNPLSAQAESGVIAGPPAAVLPPPAAAYVPQPQPAEQGDLRLDPSYALRNDAVFIDGTYVGIAKRVHDFELTPGTHEIALCAPNGDADFVDNVVIPLNGITRVRPSLERPTLNG